MVDQFMSQYLTIQKMSQKKIFHFTQAEQNETDNEKNEINEKTQLHGRWILGDNVYNDHGWAFISSWSIDPSEKTIESFVSSSHNIPEDLDDEGYNLLDQKFNWMIYSQEEWREAPKTEFRVRCHTKYPTYHSNWDWLFVTTKSLFFSQYINKQSQSSHNSWLLLSY